MRHPQFPVLALLLAAVACGAEPEAGSAADPAAGPVSGDTPQAEAPDVTTPEGKVANALSAAPEAVASGAKIVEMGADGSMTELRAGTNGWLCMPDNPKTPDPDPMCADKVWQEWFGAYMAKRPPQVGQVGTAYMLAGGSEASNTDPYATEPAAGEEWLKSGPHIMTLSTNAAQLEGYPTDPKVGGPYVMWAGTPYVHLMVPVAK